VLVCKCNGGMGIAVVNRFGQLNHTPIPIQLSERGVVPSVPSYADVHADSQYSRHTVGSSPVWRVLRVLSSHRAQHTHSLVSGCCTGCGVCWMTMTSYDNQVMLR
jgi:hypothetical protein